MSISGQNRPGSGAASWQDIEKAIERFEAAQGQGLFPRLEDYLPPNGPAREAVLVELVHADLEYRLKQGE
jgi:hypothetical protein